MLIGYARIATTEQDLTAQLDALNKAGCEQVYQDIANGARTERPGLDNALQHITKADTLVVNKLDRLGKSLSHLIQVITSVDERGICFKSLEEGIDTGSSNGKLIFHLFCALADFEQDISRERTRARIGYGRARGRLGGRPKLLDEATVEMARKLMMDKDNKADEVAEAFGVSKSTLYRYLRQGYSESE